MNPTQERISDPLEAVSIMLDVAIIFGRERKLDLGFWAWMQEGANEMERREIDVPLPTEPEEEEEDWEQLD